MQMTPLKKSIFSIALLLIVIWGVRMYQKINYNKLIFAVDMHAYIPKEASYVLQINRSENSDKLSFFTRELQPYMSKFEHMLVYPYYVIELDNNLAFFGKLDAQHEAEVKQLIEKQLFPAFPPKKMNYKDADILFYSTNDSDFVCMFYKGLFAWGYDYKIMQAIVDTQAGSGFFADSTMSDLQTKMKDSYFANFYTATDIEQSAYNIGYNGHLQLKGFLKTDEPFDRVNRKPMSVTLDYRIFPNSLTAFGMDNELIINNAFESFFKLPVYTFYMKDAPVFSIKYVGDSTKIVALLDSEERRLTSKNIQREITPEYSIYTMSANLTKSMFDEEGSLYFTFKDSCFVYADEKAALISYLNHSGSFSVKLDPNLAPLPESNSFFYTSNCHKINPEYVSLAYQSLTNDTTALIRTRPAKKFLIVDIDFIPKGVWK